MFTGEGFFPSNYHAPSTLSANCANSLPKEEADAIQQQLDIKLDKSEVKQRANAGGTTVHYLEGWRAIQLANECFGFNGWTSQILSLTTDFVLFDNNGGGGASKDYVTIGMTCVMRVTVRDGTFHEDVGYGQVDGAFGVRKLSMAFEKCRKEAVTDALKRTLRTFGSRLGNCAYDREFGKLFAVQSKPPPALPSNPMRTKAATAAAASSNPVPTGGNARAEPAAKRPAVAMDCDEGAMGEADGPSDYVPTWTNARSLVSAGTAAGPSAPAANLPSDFFCEDDDYS